MCNYNIIFFIVQKLYICKNNVHYIYSYTCEGVYVLLLVRFMCVCVFMYFNLWECVYVSVGVCACVHV